MQGRGDWGFKLMNEKITPARMVMGKVRRKVEEGIVIRQDPRGWQK
jgi:hypothetical protein